MSKKQNKNALSEESVDVPNNVSLPEEIVHTESITQNEEEEYTPPTPEEMFQDDDPNKEEVSTLIRPNDKKRKRELTPAREINEMPVSPVEFIFGSMIMKGEPNLLYGKAGSMKSMLLFLLSQHITRGEHYFGMPVMKTNVMYLDAEGVVESIRRRTDAMGIGEIDDGFYYMSARTDDVNVYDYKWRDWFIAQLKERDIELIIIDSLSRIMKGTDSDEEKFGDFRQHILDDFLANGITPIVIHHIPKGVGVAEGKEGQLNKGGYIDPMDFARGTGDIAGYFRVMTFIRKTSDGALKLLNAKQYEIAKHDEVNILINSLSDREFRLELDQKRVITLKGEILKYLQRTTDKVQITKKIVEGVEKYIKDQEKASDDYIASTKEMYAPSNRNVSKYLKVLVEDGDVHAQGKGASIRYWADQTIFGTQAEPEGKQTDIPTVNVTINEKELLKGMGVSDDDLNKVKF